MIYQRLVKVIATEVCITIRADHFEDLARAIVAAHRYFEDGHVERSTTQIEDDDLLIFLLIKTVCQCSSGRFVDDPSYFEAGNLASIFGRLALSIRTCGGPICG